MGKKKQKPEEQQQQQQRQELARLRASLAAARRIEGSNERRAAVTQEVAALQVLLCRLDATIAKCKWSNSEATRAAAETAFNLRQAAERLLDLALGVNAASRL